MGVVLGALTLVLLLLASLSGAAVAGKRHGKKGDEDYSAGQNDPYEPGADEDPNAEVFPSGPGNSHKLYNLAGGQIHWKRKNNPFTVVFLDSTTTEYDTIRGNVISDWDQSTKVSINKVQGATDSTTRANCPYADGSKREVRVCNYYYNNSSWWGAAFIKSYKGGHVVGPKIKLDNQDLDTDLKRRSTLCQEFGHILGLDHRQSGAGSCMDNDSTLDRSPNAHDYDELNNIYSHCDTTTGSCGDTQTESLEADLTIVEGTTHRHGKFVIQKFIVKDPSQPSLLELRGL